MMKDEQIDVKVIEEQVHKWEKHRRTFNEAKAMRYLNMLEKLESSTTEEQSKQKRIKVSLLSLMAFSRYERTHLVDDMINSWMDEAFRVDGHHHLANELLLRINEDFIQAGLLPEQFPQIRETDHASAKKKLANDYLQIANTFFTKVPLYQEKVDQALAAAKRIDDQEKIERFQTMNALLAEMKKPLMQIVKATESYSDSMTGIFYSASQLKEIKAAIETIESLKLKWNELTPTETSEREEDPSSLTELDQMIGLEPVKERVHRLYHYLRYQKIRKEKGYMLTDDISLHMILTGNPGTGKTTLARLLAKIYYELGMLQRPEVLEVDRSQLVGGFVGQTEENTINIIKKAVGGVLFIDEAYSLKREGAAGNDYGQTAIDTLVSAMTSGEYAGTFAVILAGYPEEMRQFLWANPGLRSRFPESNHIHLPDYSLPDLIDIAEKAAIENDYTFSDQALTELKKRIEKEQVDETFGNARTVKNIVLDAIFKKGSRVSLDEELQMNDFTMLEKEDVKEDDGQNEGSAIDELNQLVGIDDVKKEVQGLVSFVKVQQMRREKGLPVVPVQLHSTFTGNPGTGKTTVAKVYAKILKELDLLKRGHLIVTGRSDLVAGYVGQTAIKTKNKVREALGGVLFIDEAYALASGGEKDFGKEAIDTLVEEMTKHNENLVVILAGYEDDMQKLLAKNPGFTSRFKKHLHFPDFSTDEMIEIMLGYAKTYGYQLNEDALVYIRDIVAGKTINSNGRYAVDAIDKAILNHSHRVLADELTDEEATLTTLVKSDFVEAL
ncbi:AAA family ATPase [Desertibacillus haloalkaliphilus]|uniref:AAA family ATPase n=1 Tax=Desertibacillus haloalkaliphilus TaxID=1328930 RepID=UPI001C277CD1|nr:AAA family ATPase [Desertibacillus haloalkaliphilus]MBU8907433.1 AAA family ATPase [Desertibacillus haloalkaliphilus]